MWGSSTQAEGKPHIRVTPGMSCFGLSGLFWLLNSRPSYYVNRDTLFCYHKASEVFLQRLMALYVASHYKVTAADPWVNLSPTDPFYLAFHIFCYLVAQVTIPLGLTCPDIGKAR